MQNEHMMPGMPPKGTGMEGKSKKKKKISGKSYSHKEVEMARRMVG